MRKYLAAHPDFAHLRGREDLSHAEWTEVMRAWPMKRFDQAPNLLEGQIEETPGASCHRKLTVYDFVRMEFDPKVRTIPPEAAFFKALAPSLPSKRSSFLPSLKASRLPASLCDNPSYSKSGPRSSLLPLPPQGDPLEAVIQNILRLIGTCAGGFLEIPCYTVNAELGTYRFTCETWLNTEKESLRQPAKNLLIKITVVPYSGLTSL